MRPPRCAPAPSRCPRGTSPCASRRSEEHTSELQSHSGTSYAVFCLKKKKMDAAGCGVAVHAAAGLLAEERIGQAGVIARDIANLLPFFFNDPPDAEVYTPLYTLSLHAALPI